MLLLRTIICNPSFLIARIIIYISPIIARDFCDFFYWGLIWCFSPFWVIMKFNFWNCFLKSWNFYISQFFVKISWFCIGSTLHFKTKEVLYLDIFTFRPRYSKKFWIAFFSENTIYSYLYSYPFIWNTFLFISFSSIF